jgi:hypothetical protein
MEHHLTLRGAWGLQPIDEPKEWSFLQPFPQDVGYERDPKIPEFMSVSVAQQQGYMSDEIGFGRSAINRIRTTDGNATFEGRNFQQQWDRAHTVDPEIVFITGWNEWVAQRFIRKDSPAKFVDQWTTEYSRDLEPLKGDHEDAYYYQLVSNIRRFKGVRAAPEPLREHSIVIDGFFEDWNAVRTEYRDDREDPVQRDHAGWGRAGRYTDQSGRNDIVRMKATESGEFLYLLIETSAPLTPSTDEDWMVVYLDVDADASTGWLGYDLAIRSYAGDGTAAVVPLSTKENATSGNGSIFYQTKESQLELAIPKAFLGPVARREIHVKVTDNIPVAKSPRLFTLKGDAAPNDRFSYRIRFSN